jgi:hypothetical protein
MKITSPNWFKTPSIATPQIGEENQFASARGLRFGPLRVNKTGIFANNGTVDSTVITSTGFHGFNNANAELITIDASTGLNITDGTNPVLQAVINGTNVGDVSIGNYSGSSGIFYDKSDGTFNIKGVVTATAGVIGGWTLAATSLSANNVILSSTGYVTVGDGNDKVVLDITSSVGYVSFYAGGALKGRLRGTTAGAGGIAVVSGDMALDNNKSYLAKGTGSDYARFGVDGSNNTILASVSDYIQFLQNDGGSLATMGTASGGYPYFYVPEGVIQLKKMSEPSTPSADTVVIYLDTADEVLKAKDDAGNVHNLW